MRLHPPLVPEGLKCNLYVMIRNIIFDLGGVVIDLDRLKAVEALKKLGVSDAPDLLGEYAQKGPFLKLETGEISSSEFYDLLLAKCNEGTTCTRIRDAFEEFLLGIPPERLEMLEKLRQKGYGLYVLSNTNPVMYNHWIDREFKKAGKSINDYFDGIVASFQEGTCKPDPEIFKRVTDRYCLDPSETIMLDDSATNIKAAESVGLKTNLIEKEGPDSFLSVCQQLLDAPSLV